MRLLLARRFAATAPGCDTDLLPAEPLGMDSVQLFRQAMDVATLACVAPDPGGWPMRVCPGATEQSTLDRSRLAGAVLGAQLAVVPIRVTLGGGLGPREALPGAPSRCDLFILHKGSTIVGQSQDPPSWRFANLHAARRARKQRLPTTLRLVVRHIRQRPGARALAGVEVGAYAVL